MPNSRKYCTFNASHLSAGVDLFLLSIRLHRTQTVNPSTITSSITFAPIDAIEYVNGVHVSGTHIDITRADAIRINA